MPRVLHIITDLTAGGAQSMLLRLVPELARTGWDSEVIALGTPEPVGNKLQAAGIPVDSLQMGSGTANPWWIFRLARMMRNRSPDVIHTWMYHADLLGGLANLIGRRRPLVWAIHHSTLAASQTKSRTRMIARVNAKLSGFVPREIICCSETSREVHAQMGYDPSKLKVIPNGFDLSAFRPDVSARARICSKLDLPVTAPLVLHVARFHPEKNQQGLVEAAGRVLEQNKEVCFVLAGEGLEPDNPDLSRWWRQAGIPESNLRLLGPRDDIPDLMAGADLVAAASKSEAFPLVLGEAMACGTPCVATDVGDSAELISDTGRVVPPDDAVSLATAIMEILALTADDRAAIGARARQRIQDRYSLNQTAQEYVAVYESIRSQV